MGNKIPFFSIVIPLYNKENYIEDTLKSVVNQNFKDFEIIIVDDGSVDASLQIVENFDKIPLRILRQKNQGVSVARNHGIKNAEGRYIALLDADDIWFPNHLSEIKKAIHQFPNESIFCNNYEILISEKTTKPTLFSFQKSIENITCIEDFFEASRLNSIITSSTVCIKNTVFTEGYYFAPKILSGQDTDLWIRLGLKYSFVFNSTKTVQINKNIPFSLSKSSNIESRYNFTQKYLEEEKTNPSLHRFLNNNRFAIALQCKEAQEFEILKQLKSQIDFKLLNKKQQLLLKLPRLFIILLKKVKQILELLKINISTYQ